MTAPLRKTSAWILLFTFLCQQTVWGIEPLNIRAAEVPAAFELRIPESLAQIEDLYIAPHPQGQFIFHIQDAHVNEEAQVKIRELLEYLHEQYGVKKMFLEGAGGKINADALQVFSDEALNAKLAENLARAGELSGPELFLLKNKNKGISAGPIEDPELYRMNYETLKRVFQTSGPTHAFIQAYEERLDRISSKVFSTEARRMIAEWRRFQAGHREFLPYIQSLSVGAKKIIDLDLESLFAQLEWPELTRLIAMQNMEKEVDFEKARIERESLLTFLKQKKLPEALIREVEKFPLEPEKIVHVRSADFQREEGPRQLLEKLAAQAGPKGFYFHDYPSFSLAAGYTILMNELDTRQLFEEVETLFQKILDTLTQTARERTLLELVQDTTLLQKLPNLELGRKDWQKAIERKTLIEIKSMESRLADLEGQTTDHRPQTKDQNQKLSPIPRSLDFGLLSSVFLQALRFYELAIEREAVFYQKITEAYSKDSLDRVAVITGGFHTEGLTDLFRKAEMSYATLTPRMNASVEKWDPTYKDIMLQSRKSVFDLKAGADLLNAGSSTLKLVLALLDRATQSAMGLDMNLMYQNLLSRAAETLNLPYNLESVWPHLSESFRNELRAFNNGAMNGKRREIKDALEQVETLLSTASENRAEVQQWQSELQRMDALEDSIHQAEDERKPLSVRLGFLRLQEPLLSALRGRLIPFEQDKRFDELTALVDAMQAKNAFLISNTIFGLSGKKEERGPKLLFEPNQEIESKIAFSIKKYREAVQRTKDEYYRLKFEIRQGFAYNTTGGYYLALARNAKNNRVAKLGQNDAAAAESWRNSALDWYAASKGNYQKALGIYQSYETPNPEVNATLEIKKTETVLSRIETEMKSLDPARAELRSFPGLAKKIKGTQSVKTLQNLQAEVLGKIQARQKIIEQRGESHPKIQAELDELKKVDQSILQKMETLKKNANQLLADLERLYQLRDQNPITNAEQASFSSQSPWFQLKKQSLQLKSKTKIKGMDNKSYDLVRKQLASIQTPFQKTGIKPVYELAFLIQHLAHSVWMIDLEAGQMRLDQILKEAATPRQRKELRTSEGDLPETEYYAYMPSRFGQLAGSTGRLVMPVETVAESRTGQSVKGPFDINFNLVKGVRFQGLDGEMRQIAGRGIDLISKVKQSGVDWNQLIEVRFNHDAAPGLVKLEARVEARSIDPELGRQMSAFLTRVSENQPWLEKNKLPTFMRPAFWETNLGLDVADAAEADRIFQLALSQVEIEPTSDLPEGRKRHLLAIAEKITEWSQRMEMRNNEVNTTFLKVIPEIAKTDRVGQQGRDTFRLFEIHDVAFSDSATKTIRERIQNPKYDVYLVTADQIRNWKTVRMPIEVPDAQGHTKTVDAVIANNSLPLLPETQPEQEWVNQVIHQVTTDYIRISSAGLARIVFNIDGTDYYLLVLNKDAKTTGIYKLAPFGGAIGNISDTGMTFLTQTLKVDPNAFEGVEKAVKKANAQAVQESKTLTDVELNAVKATAERDLRFTIAKESLPALIHWFLSRKDRETDVTRELGEELVDEQGIFTQEEWLSISGQDTSDENFRAEVRDLAGSSKRTKSDFRVKELVLTPATEEAPLMVLVPGEPGPAGGMTKAYQVSYLIYAAKSSKETQELGHEGIPRDSDHHAGHINLQWVWESAHPDYPHIGEWKIDSNGTAPVIGSTFTNAEGRKIGNKIEKYLLQRFAPERGINTLRQKTDGSVLRRRRVEVREGEESPVTSATQHVGSAAIFGGRNQSPEKNRAEVRVNDKINVNKAQTDEIEKHLSAFDGSQQKLIVSEIVKRRPPAGYSDAKQFTQILSGTVPGISMAQWKLIANTFEYQRIFFTSNRRVWLRNTAIAGAFLTVGGGLVWRFADQNKTSELFSDLSWTGTDADIQTIITALDRTINEVLKENYPHAEVLRNYRKLLKSAEPAPSASLFDKYMKGNQVQLRINVLGVRGIIQYIHDSGSNDLLFILAAIVSGEAWGAKQLSTSSSERIKFQEIVRELKGKQKQITPRLVYDDPATKRFILDQINEIVQAFALHFSGEVHESWRIYEFMQWATKRGLYSEARAIKAIDRIAQKRALPIQRYALLDTFLQHRLAIFTLHQGAFDGIVKQEFSRHADGTLPEIFGEIQKRSFDFTRIPLFFYCLLEFYRHENNPMSRQGINPNFVDSSISRNRMIVSGTVPPDDLDPYKRIADSELLAPAEIKKILLSWARHEHVTDLEQWLLRPELRAEARSKKSIDLKVPNQRQELRLPDRPAGGPAVAGTKEKMGEGRREMGDKNLWFEVARHPALVEGQSDNRAEVRSTKPIDLKAYEVSKINHISLVHILSKYNQDLFNTHFTAENRRPWLETIAQFLDFYIDWMKQTDQLVLSADEDFRNSDKPIVSLIADEGLQYGVVPALIQAAINVQFNQESLESLRALAADLRSPSPRYPSIRNLLTDRKILSNQALFERFSRLMSLRADKGQLDYPGVQKFIRDYRSPRAEMRTAESRLDEGRIAAAAAQLIFFLKEEFENQEVIKEKIANYFNALQFETHYATQLAATDQPLGAPIEIHRIFRQELNIEDPSSQKEILIKALENLGHSPRFISLVDAEAQKSSKQGPRVELRTSDSQSGNDEVQLDTRERLTSDLGSPDAVVPRMNNLPQTEIPNLNTEKNRAEARSTNSGRVRSLARRLESREASLNGDQIILRSDGRKRHLDEAQLFLDRPQLLIDAIKTSVNLDSKSLKLVSKLSHLVSKTTHLISKLSHFILKTFKLISKILHTFSEDPEGTLDVLKDNLELPLSGEVVVTGPVGFLSHGSRSLQQLREPVNINLDDINYAKEAIIGAALPKETLEVKSQAPRAEVRNAKQTLDLNGEIQNFAQTLKGMAQSHSGIQAVRSLLMAHQRDPILRQADSFGRYILDESVKKQQQGILSLANNYHPTKNNAALNQLFIWAKEEKLVDENGFLRAEVRSTSQPEGLIRSGQVRLPAVAGTDTAERIAQSAERMREKTPDTRNQTPEKNRAEVRATQRVFDDQTLESLHRLFAGLSHIAFEQIGIEFIGANLEKANQYLEQLGHPPLSNKAQADKLWKIVHIEKALRILDRKSGYIEFMKHTIPAQRFELSNLRPESAATDLATATHIGPDLFKSFFMKERIEKVLNQVENRRNYNISSNLFQVLELSEGKTDLPWGKFQIKGPGHLRWRQYGESQLMIELITTGERPGLFIGQEERMTVPSNFSIRTPEEGIAASRALIDKIVKDPKLMNTAPLTDAALIRQFIMTVARDIEILKYVTDITDIDLMLNRPTQKLMREFYDYLIKHYDPETGLPRAEVRSTSQPEGLIRSGQVRSIARARMVGTSRISQRPLHFRSQVRGRSSRSEQPVNVRPLRVSHEAGKVSPVKDKPEAAKSEENPAQNERTEIRKGKSSSPVIVAEREVAVSWKTKRFQPQILQVSKIQLPAAVYKKSRLIKIGTGREELRQLAHLTGRMLSTGIAGRISPVAYAAQDMAGMVEAFGPNTSPIREHLSELVGEELGAVVDVIDEADLPRNAAGELEIFNEDDRDANRAILSNPNQIKVVTILASPANLEKLQAKAVKFMSGEIAWTALNQGFPPIEGRFEIRVIAKDSDVTQALKAIGRDLYKRMSTSKVISGRLRSTQYFVISAKEELLNHLNTDVLPAVMVQTGDFKNKIRQAAHLITAQISSQILADELKQEVRSVVDLEGSRMILNALKLAGIAEKIRSEIRAALAFGKAA